MFYILTYVHAYQYILSVTYIVQYSYGTVYYVCMYISVWYWYGTQDLNLLENLLVDTYD